MTNAFDKSMNAEERMKPMLRLRPYKECDAESIVGWIKDEGTFYRWSAGRFGRYPITAEEINKSYKDAAMRDDFYEMTAFDEQGAAGHLIMRFLDEKKTILRFGFVIVDDERRGKGYGKEMLRLALKYAFEILKVSKVTIGVFENNPAAYACYRSVGFQDASEEMEIYSILGEEWKCRELELTEYPI